MGMDSYVEEMCHSHVACQDFPVREDRCGSADEARWTVGTDEET